MYCTIFKHAHLMFSRILNLRNLIFSVRKTKQGRKWRVGRVGNCPPSFWQNRRRLWVAARRQWRATSLLAHPVLGSYLRLCSRNLFVCHEFQQWGFSKGTVRLYCVVDTGYGLGKSLGGLQTCIAGRSKVPNG